MSRVVDTALDALLRGDATLSGLVGGRIYNTVPDEGSATPFVVYQQQAHTPTHTAGRSSYVHRWIYLVKGVTESDSKKPGYTIAERVHTLLQGATPALLSGWSLMLVRQDSEVDFPEQSGDQLFWHIGSTWEVIASA